MQMKKISKIAANVFVIQDPMFPLYLIKGAKNILLDCAILAKGAEIEASLAEILGNEKVDTVLLTHSHYDHTGACTYLQAKHRFDILASQRTKEILQNPKAIEFIDKLNQEFKHILKKDNPLHVTMPENLNVVGEGDTIPVSPDQWLQVYETPGHTRCSLSYLLCPDNILFPGDAAGVLEKDQTIKPLFLIGFSQYLSSLEKLYALKADTLALPHNQPIKNSENVDAFFKRSIQETHKLKARILDELQVSSDFEAIAERIFAREYPLPTIDGPREALLINLTAMIKAVYHEFVKKVE